MNSVTQGVTKHKVGLPNLAAEQGNVSLASKVMGFFCDTFYRYKSAVEGGGVEALILGIEVVAKGKAVCTDLVLTAPMGLVQGYDAVQMELPFVSFVDIDRFIVNSATYLCFVSGRP